MQAVFEKIIEKLEEEKMSYFFAIANTGDEKLDCAYEHTGDALDKAIEIVKQAAEQYNNGWIPCSERLPIEEKYRKRIDGIWCYRHLLVSTNETDVPIQIGWYGQEDETWYDMDGFAFYPTAWRELPEPYQPKGE